MTTSLLSRIQTSRVQGLEAIYDSWSESPDDAARHGDLLILVEECRYGIKEGLRLWEGTKRDLIQDSPHYGDDLNNYGSLITGILARIVNLAEKVCTDAEKFTKETGPVIEGAEALKTEAMELKALRERIVVNWPWADKDAWPPLNKDMQKKAREEYEAGQWEDAGAILRRVQSGGPLVQE